MKILILTRHFYPIDRPSGVVTLIREFAYAFKRLGHEVEIVCKQSASDERTHYTDNAGLHIHKYKQLSPMAFSKIDKAFQADRIIIFSSISSGSLLLIWWWVNISLSQLLYKTHFYQTTNLTLSHLNKVVFKYFLKSFRSTYTANLSIPQEIKLTRHDFTLLLPGTNIETDRNQRISPRKLKQELNPQSFSICFMGHISEIKGADIVLDLAERLPDFQFNIIAGYSPGKKNIEFYEKALIRIKQLDNVTHHGFISDPLETLAKNDLLILPYRGGETVLGVAQSAIEAMAVGIPVLATHNEAVSEIVVSGYNGDYAESLDQFEERILALSCNAEDYYSRSEAAIETVKSNFNINIQATKLLNT